MSFMHLTCPWCGDEYTFGVVGRQVVGSGHHCRKDVRCRAHRCRRLGVFQVAMGPTSRFVCPDHIDGRTILGCQPGRMPRSAKDAA